MKRNIIIYSLFIITITLFSCKSHKEKYEIVTDRIIYDTKVLNVDPDADPWLENIEGPQRDKFINLIMDAVKNNKVKIYDVNHKELKYEDVITHLMTYDTIKSSNKKGPNSADEVLISNGFDKNKITQFRFDERWTMSDKTFDLKKEVFGFCPIMAEDNKEGITKYKQPLFWIYPDTNVTDTSNATFVITKKIQYSVLIKAKEKSTDWWVNNIETTQRDSFINKIINAVLDNKLKAYDYSDKLVTKESFNKMNYFSDTLTELDDVTGEMKTSIINHDLDKKSIIIVRFTEEWSYNTKTFKFNKRILALSPMTEVLGGQGELRGYRSLFTVYFDESLKPTK